LRNISGRRKARRCWSPPGESKKRKAEAAEGIRDK